MRKITIFITVAMMLALVIGCTVYDGSGSKIYDERGNIAVVSIESTLGITADDVSKNYYKGGDIPSGYVMLLCVIPSKHWVDFPEADSTVTITGNNSIMDPLFDTTNNWDPGTGVPAARIGKYGNDFIYGALAEEVSGTYDADNGIAFVVTPYDNISWTGKEAESGGQYQFKFTID